MSIIDVMHVFLLGPAHSGYIIDQARCRNGSIILMRRYRMMGEILFRTAEPYEVQVLTTHPVPFPLKKIGYASRAEARRAYERTITDLGGETDDAAPRG